jgi:hypothetical protein
MLELFDPRALRDQRIIERACYRCNVFRADRLAAIGEKVGHVAG